VEWFYLDRLILMDNYFETIIGILATALIFITKAAFDGEHPIAAMITWSVAILVGLTTAYKHIEAARLSRKKRQEIEKEDENENED
jgi:hypothetical protein